jgi:DnaJ-class molecular chaperone
MPPKGSKKMDCPDCNGTGIVSVGDVDMECATCNGKGTQSGAQK